MQVLSMMTEPLPLDEVKNWNFIQKTQRTCKNYIAPTWADVLHCTNYIAPTWADGKCTTAAAWDGPMLQGIDYKASEVLIHSNTWKQLNTPRSYPLQGVIHFRVLSGRWVADLN